MSEAAFKTVKKTADPPPTAGVMFVRNLFGWLYITSLAVLRGVPACIEPWFARQLARFFRIPEEKLNLRNAPIVFGDEAAGRMLEKRFQYQTRLKCDIAHMKGAGPSGILARVQVSGVENLRAALDEKKGVLLVSAHAGTWWHAPAVVAALGMPVSSVLTQFLPVPIVRFLEQVARELNCALTFVRMGAYEAARAAFKKGEIFFLSFDFASRTDRSIIVPIGVRAELPVDTGPGVMAVRHQVPVVWVDTHHDENGRSCIHFHPAIHAGRGTPHPKPESVLLYLIDRLKDQIVRYPEQWWLLGHSYLNSRSETVEPPPQNPV